MVVINCNLAHDFYKYTLGQGELIDLAYSMNSSMIQV